MEVMAAGGSRGGEETRGGQSPFHWAEGTGMVALGDLGGLRQTNLVRKERLGVQGVGRGRQAGLVPGIRGEVGNPAA